MPRDDPKVMFTARLPGDLIAQLDEVAAEEGVSRTEVVVRLIGEWLDNRGSERGRQGAG